MAVENQIKETVPLGLSFKFLSNKKDKKLADASSKSFNLHTERNEDENEKDYIVYAEGKELQRFNMIVITIIIISFCYCYCCYYYCYFYHCYHYYCYYCCCCYYYYCYY